MRYYNCNFYLDMLYCEEGHRKRKAAFVNSHDYDY